VSAFEPRFLRRGPYRPLLQSIACRSMQISGGLLLGAVAGTPLEGLELRLSAYGSPARG
jgi:hypothetical protein